MGTLNLSDRVLAWLVSGPVGRFVAFGLDFSAALLEAARAAVARRLGRDSRRR